MSRDSMGNCFLLIPETPFLIETPGKVKASQGLLSCGGQEKRTVGVTAFRLTGSYLPAALETRHAANYNCLKNVLPSQAAAGPNHFTEAPHKHGPRDPPLCPLPSCTPNAANPQNLAPEMTPKKKHVRDIPGPFPLERVAPAQLSRGPRPGSRDRASASGARRLRCSSRAVRSSTWRNRQPRSGEAHGDLGDLGEPLVYGVVFRESFQEARWLKAPTFVHGI